MSKPTQSNTAGVRLRRLFLFPRIIGSKWKCTMLMSLIGWIMLGSVAGLSLATSLVDVTKALRWTPCPAFSAH